MLNPLLSIDRVSSWRTLDKLEKLYSVTNDEDLLIQIHEHKEFLVKTKPVSKNVFGICLGLSYWE